MDLSVEAQDLYPADVMVDYMGENRRTVTGVTVEPRGAVRVDFSGGHMEEYFRRSDRVHIIRADAPEPVTIEVEVQDLMYLDFLVDRDRTIRGVFAEAGGAVRLDFLEDGDHPVWCRKADRVQVIRPTKLI